MNSKRERTAVSEIQGGGTYILVIWVAEDQDVVVGNLGPVPFRAGHYLYVGSALGGLSARLARHLRQRKALHWHIDYLLQHGRIEEIWYRVDRHRLECAWARALGGLPDVSALRVRFGASDCSCPTHLFHSPARPELHTARPALGDRGPETALTAPFARMVL